MVTLVTSWLTKTNLLVQWSTLKDLCHYFLVWAKMQGLLIAKGKT